MLSNTTNQPKSTVELYKWFCVLNRRAISFFNFIHKNVLKTESRVFLYKSSNHGPISMSREKNPVLKDV